MEIRDEDDGLESEEVWLDVRGGLLRRLEVHGETLDGCAGAGRLSVVVSEGIFRGARADLHRLCRWTVVGCQAVRGTAPCSGPRKHCTRYRQ